MNLPIRLAIAGAAIRSGTTQAPTHLPMEYLDRVNDLYGPGVFLTWILVAYSTIINIMLDESSDTLSYDFIATLLYPVVVASHLVVQVCRYPASWKDIWSPPDNKLVPYSAAIHASSTVCLNAMAFIAVSLVVVCGEREGPEAPYPKKRLCLLVITAMWIFIALCLEGLHAILSIVLLVVLWAVMPFAAWWILRSSLFVISGILHIYKHVRARIRGSDSTTWRDVISACFPLGFGVVHLLVVAYGLHLVLWLWEDYIPRSKYALADLSQAFTLAGRCLNAGFIAFKVYRRHGKDIWEENRIDK